MVKNLALFLSVVFHPLLMTSYGSIILLFGLRDSVYDFLTPYDVKWKITLVVFSFSFLLPVLNIYLMYRYNKIPSFILSKQEHRTFPYLVSSLFYFGLFYLLMDLNIWNSLKLFILGGGIAILLTAVINLKQKISAHMVGLGGLLGVFISVAMLLKLDLTLLYITVVILAGVVGSARLFLEEHHPAQLLSGFVLGLLVQTFLFYGLQKLSFNYIL